MGKTSIEWTDASWNPIVGCTEISPGCANCYAARLAATRLRETPAYKGLATTGDIGPGWTGEVRFLPERLNEPLHWKTPRRIFVCDMGDLFHEKTDIRWIDQIFEVMVRAPWHTYQLLTKRAQNLNAYMLSRASGAAKFLPNVWLGVSVENQHFADKRIPLLLATPAAVRWISAEPLLGPIAIRRFLHPCKEMETELWKIGRPTLDWVVAGGESGPNARPMHPMWARGLRDQCEGAGVPFFFKQWGEWQPILSDARPGKNLEYVKLGKKVAGRTLDGREWNEFPGAERTET